MRNCWIMIDIWGGGENELLYIKFIGFRNNFFSGLSNGFCYCNFWYPILMGDYRIFILGVLIFIIILSRNVDLGSFMMRKCWLVMDDLLSGSIE